MDRLDHLWQRQVFGAGNFLENTPERGLGPNRGAVAVNTKAALFGNEFVDLIGSAGIEHVPQHAVRLDIDRFFWLPVLAHVDSNGRHWDHIGINTTRPRGVPITI